MRMIIFISIFLSIYAAMHLVVYWGVKPLLPSVRWGATILWSWIGIMMVAPILMKVLDRAGHEGIARCVAFMGLCWMGFLFLAFSIFVVLGAWEIVAWIISKGIPSLPPVSLRGPLLSGTVLLITLLAGLYSFFEARHLTVETVSLTTDKLENTGSPLRIIQISDLHLGLLQGKGILNPVIARIQALTPDLLLATGDVIDSQINHRDDLIHLFKELNPPLGKFAVFGNHEGYVGTEKSLDFLERSGFTVLRNAAVVLSGSLTVVGLDEDSEPLSSKMEIAILEKHKNTGFTIALKHRPTPPKTTERLFDLQLSGHAHRGQIFPFNLVTGLKFPFQNGLTKLPNGAHLYASRGTGSWGPPMRLLSPPEITLFIIDK